MAERTNPHANLIIGARDEATPVFEKIKASSQSMAAGVEQAATKAAGAVGGMGDKAAPAAQKLDSVTSSMIRQVQRLNAELEAGGARNAAYFEKMASLKGADTAALSPYIAQLKQAEDAQRVATTGLDHMGMSAKQTTAALRQVPMQFTDIVVSLQGGQSAMQVFLQQGGQLKDMFGGAGNAARALGGYVLGLVNPFTVAAAAAAALAYAYNQGSKEADAYNKALITTGNAAGTNAAQLKAYAQEISGVVGTQGKAAESLAALASTGKIGAESLKEAAQAAVQYERATGQAVSKTAEQFASLRNEPLAAVLKLNDGMNFLTESTYRQIKSLEEQGKTAEAANVAQRAFADTLSGRAGEMERNLGTVERGWLAVKDAAKSAWDAILNVGRASTSVDQLAEVRKQIAQRENQIANGGFGTNEGGAAFGRPSQAATERLRAELAGLQAKAAALEGVAYATRVSADEERKRGEAVKAGAAFDKAGEKYLSDKTRMERELAAARVQGAEAGRSQAEIEKRLSEIRASYAKKGGSSVATENKELRDQQRIFAELAGVSSTYYAELANAQKQRAAGVITEQQYVTAVQSLIEKQPFAVALAKEEAAAAKALSKAYAEAAAERIKTIQSMERAADSLQSQNDALREEIELIGLSTEQQTLVLQQRNDVIILTKEATLAELERQSAITGTQTRVEIALASEIEALKERNALLGAKGVKNAAVDAAKSAADEWQKTSDKINDTLTDALMRGFESGKDFAKNLRDTVINMFKTMVLRPVISAIVNPFAGSVTSALGLSGAQGGGNSVMGGIQTASNLNTLYGAGAQALWGGTAGASAASLGYANTVGAVGGDALGALISSNGGWSGVSAGGAAGAGGFGAIPVVGWIAAGMMAASSAYKQGYSANDLKWSNPIGLVEKATTKLLTTLGVSDKLANILTGASLTAKILMWGAGTPHMGAGAIYSEAGGLQEGKDLYSGANFGMGMPEEYTKGMQEGVSAVAKNIADMFDGVAETFGQKAGFEIATAFADDTSKDGAWGSLRISQAGKDLLNWNDTRESKWAPREFANGEEGYKEYLAEIAKDTRTVLLDMDLPSWADTMLESIGEAANMDQLAATVQQIGVVQTTFVQLGKTMGGFAGLTDKAFEALMKASGGFEALSANAGTYYENFYSEAEKTANVTRSVSDALAQVGVAMPTTRDEFRALVESQLALGESGAEAVAVLLGVSGAFASVVPAAEAAGQAIGDVLSEAMKRLQSDTAGLQIELLRAQGNISGANAAQRTLDTTGLSDAEIAVYDYNESLRAQIDTLTRATAQRYDLETQLLELQGNTAELRARELAGIDASNHGLQVWVWALQDLAAASEQAVEAERNLIDARAQAAQQAYSAAQAATSASLSSVDRAVGAQREGYDAARSAALEAAQEVKSLIDTLSSGIKGLYGEVESARTASAAEGLAFIDNALRNARATGYLPDSSALNDAISSASSGIGAKQYTSQADQDFDRLVLAGQLKELNGYAEPQLTAAEQAARSAEDQIKALDDILRNARDQVDELRGIDTSVKTIPEALAALQAALVAESQAQTQAFLAGTVASLSSGQIKPQDAIKQLEGNGAVVPREQWTDLAGTQAWVSTGGATALGGTPTSGLDAMISSKTGAQFTVRTATDYVNDAVRKGDLRSIYDAAVLHGISSTSLDAMMGWPGGTALDWAKSQGLPAFAVGTNYVPQDMAAIVHKGEMIVPAAYNPAANPGMSGNTARLESLVQALTAEVAELKGLQRDSNRHQRRTAEAVNGNPDAPMLVETV